MAAQNGKTGVPTGSLSDNHIFLVRSQTNLYIIEYKQVCTRRSIAPVYEKQYAQSSRTNLWLLLAYKRKFGSPDKPGGLSIQLCKSEKKEFYIRYSS